MMSLNEKCYSLDIKKDNNIVKLVNELCVMTECDQEQAYIQLSNCNFDFETAANKILESSSTNQLPDSEWQIINRQKKFKKKLEKIDVDLSGDGFKKIDSSRHNKYKNQNQKGDHFKNEDKLINQNRVHRNKKNRFPTRKPKEIIEAQIPDNTNAAVDSFIISDSENELRWDNVADIDGAFKESSNNSQIDGFYSEDDFGQLDDHSYHGLSTQLVSDIDQKYKSKIDTSDNATNRDQPYSSQTESQIINDFLSNQLPIFGNFSQTQPPPSMSIIPDQPVSFFRDIKPKIQNMKQQYHFGINIRKELSSDQTIAEKRRNSKDDQVQKANSSEQTKIFLNKNQIISPNDSYRQLTPPGITNKNYIDILQSLYRQQKTVAMVLGNHTPSSYYDPMNMITLPNPNQFEQMYAMNIHAAHHQNVENGIAIQNQDGFIPQSTFHTSNNMSVPFHANRK